ncbi:MAG: SRPBCC family protein, partial [Pseudomonadota bacterium]
MGQIAGALRGIPHEKPGFPGLNRASLGLRRLPAAERLGLIWVIADPESYNDIDAHIAPLTSDFAWFDMANMGVAASDTFERQANWKLLMEGGIEAYHFKVAHRDTIGPHFLDNLSSYEMLGAHMRSVLPRTSLTSLHNVPREDWSIRDHTNVLYTVFPTTQFLLMQDHVGWLNFRPLGPDRTEIRLTTLAPKS